MSKLHIAPNPHRGKPMAIHLNRNVDVLDSKFMLHMIYIPDREIVHEEHYQQFIDALLGPSTFETPEEFLSTLSDIFYDTALPHYVKFTLSHEKDGLTHKVQSVRTQPGYVMPTELKDII